MRRAKLAKSSSIKPHSRESGLLGWAGATARGGHPVCELGRLVSQCLRLLETPHPRIDDQSRAPGPLCTGNSRPITARLPLRFGLLVLYRNSTDRASTRHQGPRCCRWPHSRRLAPGRKSQWHKMPMLRCRPFFDWLFLLQIFVTGPASRLWQAGCCENTAGSLRLSTLRFEVEPWKTSDTGLFVMDCKAPPGVSRNLGCAVRCTDCSNNTPYCGGCFGMREANARSKLEPWKQSQPSQPLIESRSSPILLRAPLPFVYAIHVP